MSKTEIIGSNQTTPGAATAPSTLLTDTTSTTGLLIKQGAGAPASQVPIQVKDYSGVVVWEVTNAGHMVVYNMRLGAVAGVFQQPVSLNGQQNPPCVQLPDGTSSVGLRIWSGTDVPGRSISVTNSSNANDTLTSTAHGLPATATPVIFTAKSGLSESPTITLTTTTYFVQQVTDANTLKVWTDYAMTSQVLIGADGGTATFYIQNVGTPVLGSWYFRLDTPTVANQWWYVCSTAGTPGTWTGIA